MFKALTSIFKVRERGRKARVKSIIPHKIVAFQKDLFSGPRSVQGIVIRHRAQTVWDTDVWENHMTFSSIRIRPNFVIKYQPERGKRVIGLL